MHTYTRCTMCGDEYQTIYELKLIGDAFMSQRVRDYSGGKIDVCGHCRSRLILDTNTLEKESFVNGDDGTLLAFLTSYIQSPSVVVEPSFQELATACKRAGVFTSKGQTWKYHNLRQKLIALDFSKTDCFASCWRSKQLEMKNSGAVDIRSMVRMATGTDTDEDRQNINEPTYTGMTFGG